MPSPAEYINIQVKDRKVLDESLNAAVRDLQHIAMRSRTHGIVVTRNGPGDYTAALTDKVPYGITREVFL